MTDSMRPHPTPRSQLAAPTTASVSASDEAAYAKFGRIAEDGTVYVNDAGTERAVGQYPDGLPENPLHLYIRRFLDLKIKLDVFESRLQHLDAREIDKTVKALRQELAQPQAVGDLAALRERFEQLATAAEERKVQIREEREASRKAAYARREEIVAAAEAIAAQDPNRTQWKNSAQSLRDLLEQWKSAQRSGPRLDRADEDALWKRFAAARSTFDRGRRHFFSQLDAAQSEARRRKEKLVERAEALSDSREWGTTAAAYRDLMNEWKAAGRAARRDDDALWERFRAAQQRFFDARRAENDALDASYEENLRVKEELLQRAEALLPIIDIEAAKAQLRPIQDEWDAAGRVPRADVERIEGRMRAVEDALRDAEEEHWRRSNPETQARAQGMLGQLETQLEELEASHDAAVARGDDAAAKKLADELATKRAWLDQVRNMTK